MDWNTEDLESVPCDCCGGGDNRPVIVRPDGMTVVACVRCGLCFLNPRPRADRLTAIYEGGYFAHATDHEGVGYADYCGEGAQEVLLGYSRARLDVLSDVVRLDGAACLEVGCATGEFCCALRDHGARPAGIDLCGDAIALAKTRYPEIDFRCGTIEGLPSTDMFDIVFAYDVIEHLVSPQRFIREAARRVRPGGHVVIATPNYGCAQAIGVDRWSGFQTSFEHLYFLDSKSLGQYADRAGLSVARWFTGGGDGLASGEALPPRFQRLKRVLGSVRLLSFARKTHAAVVHQRGTYVRGGTNHRVLMVMKRNR